MGRSKRAGRWWPLVVLALLLACGRGPEAATPPPRTIELTAERERVGHGAGGGALEPLPLNQSQRARAGDRIDVSPSGQALLRFEDFLSVRLFRDTELRLLAETDPAAPPLLRYRLEAGATFNTLTPGQAAQQRLEIQSGSDVVIKDAGTRFLAYVDRQTRLSWVVVAEGSVAVSAAGKTVTVAAQQQTWVPVGQPPVDPQPATRAAVGNLVPPIDQITGASLRDGDLLSGPAAPTAPPTLPPTRAPTQPPTATARSAATATATTATRPPSPTPPASPTPTRPPPAAPAGVTAIAFTPAGDRLAVGRADGTVTLHDTASGRVLRVLEHGGDVNALAIAPDGRQLAVSVVGGLWLVQLWDLTNFRPLTTLKPEGRVAVSLSYAPDGQRLLLGTLMGTVELWSLPAGRLERQLAEALTPPQQVAFSAGGRLVASGSGDNQIRLWETTSGRLLHTLKGHTGTVLGVAFLQRDTGLVSAGADRSLRLWSVAEGRELAQQPLVGSVRLPLAMTLAPGETVLLVGSADGLIRLQPLAAGQTTTAQVPRPLALHRAPVSALDSVLAAGGRPLLASGDDSGLLVLTELSGERVVWRACPAGAVLADGRCEVPR